MNTTTKYEDMPYAVTPTAKATKPRPQPKQTVPTKPAPRKRTVKPTTTAKIQAPKPIVVAPLKFTVTATPVNRTLAVRNAAGGSNDRRKL